MLGIKANSISRLLLYIILFYSFIILGKKVYMIIINTKNSIIDNFNQLNAKTESEFKDASGFGVEIYKIDEKTGEETLIDSYGHKIIHSTAIADKFIDFYVDDNNILHFK